MLAEGSKIRMWRNSLFGLCKVFTVTITIVNFIKDFYNKEYDLKMYEFPKSTKNKQFGGLYHITGRGN